MSRPFVFGESGRTKVRLRLAREFRYFYAVIRKAIEERVDKIAGLAYMVCILTRRHVWAKNGSHSSSLETGFIGRHLCYASYLILRAR